MQQVFQPIIKSGDGVISRDEALQVASSQALEWAIKQRQLVQILPELYAARINDGALVAAATRYAAPSGALSHTTALWAWGLLRTLRRPLHITVPAIGRQPRGSSLITTHRQHRQLDVVSRNGRPITSLEAALLDSTSFLERDLWRAAMIKAVRERRTTAALLQRELLLRSNLKGRASARRLIGLLAEGCQSELELFGYTKVFRHPSMPTLKSQYPVRLRNRTVYLDVAHEELRVAIELDGAEFHDGPAYVERDRRRDIELAAHGWVVLRFSARRLRDDPAGVRREVLEVIAARSAQLLAS